MTYFAEASDPLPDSLFVIYGVPYDRTASFRRGQRLAPDEIRKASYNFESWVFRAKVDISDVPIHDLGNLGEFGQPEEMIEEVSTSVENIVRSGKIPIGLGGEHTISYAALKGTVEAGKRPKMIVIDAHADMRDKYLGEIYSHACTSRRCSELIGIENLYIVGYRSISSEEVEYLNELSEKGIRIKFYTSFEVNSKGILEVIHELEKEIGDSDVYFSIDMDGIDPAFAPGVGTPEPFGIMPMDVLLLIEHFADRIVGIDITEITPPYDNGNTSALAAYYVMDFIAEKWRSSHEN